MIKVVMISLSSLISDGRTTALLGLTPDNVVMSRVCEATSTENSENNAWNVNASNGNVNNNNKNNQNSVRALVVHVKPQHRYDNVIFKHYEYELELRRAA